MAPWAGFEPATDRLTVDCSTTELPRNIFQINEYRKTFFMSNHKWRFPSFLYILQRSLLGNTKKINFSRCFC